MDESGDRIVILAKELFDGKAKRDACFVVVEGNRIVDVTSSPLVCDFEGYVTPAFIDAHSHIGMVRAGYGPLGSVKRKIELKNSWYGNVKLLMDSGAFYGLMTDHPIIPCSTIRESLKYFLMFGMSDCEAISMITWKNAKILEIDDELGSIEKGKLASLIVWNKHPLCLGAVPTAIFGEGKILRNRTS